MVAEALSRFLRLRGICRRIWPWPISIQIVFLFLVILPKIKLWHWNLQNRYIITQRINTKKKKKMDTALTPSGRLLSLAFQPFKSWLHRIAILNNTYKTWKRSDPCRFGIRSTTRYAPSILTCFVRVRIIIFSDVHDVAITLYSCYIQWRPRRVYLSDIIDDAIRRLSATEIDSKYYIQFGKSVRPSQSNF